MKEKNIGGLFNKQWETENASTLSDFEQEVETTDSIFEQDKKNWEAIVKEHPSMFDLRRDKQKLRDFYQKDDVMEMINKSRDILKDMDSLSYLTKKNQDDDEYDSGKNLYDTKAYRRKNKASYGIDDEFIQFIKNKIENTKQKKGRGIFISCHKYNEQIKVDRLIRCMQSGLKIALISDAGTPTLSDPGNLIVNACIRESIAVEALPGPCSITVALSGSGFPLDTYNFVGYLPKTYSEKLEKLEQVKLQEKTFLLFENKNRVLKTLMSIEKVFGKRQMVSLGIELTKLHERNLRGTVESVYDKINTNSDYTIPSLKGEITITVAPYIAQFNKELYAEKEEDEKDFYERQKLFDRTLEMENTKNQEFSIKAGELVRSLDDTLEIGHKDLVELVSTILKIPSNKAQNIVRFTRQEKDDNVSFDMELEKRMSKLVKHVMED